jgi:hypothetical protein
MPLRHHAAAAELYPGQPRARRGDATTVGPGGVHLLAQRAVLWAGENGLVVAADELVGSAFALPAAGVEVESRLKGRDWDLGEIRAYVGIALTWESGRLRFRLWEGDDVAGFGGFVEVEFGLAGFELGQHCADARFDGGIVGAVAGDEFFDDRAEGRGRQKCVGDSHGVMVLHEE